MRRDQLEHAIRTACQIIERATVVVVGSQTIHGTFTEDQLPPEATMSVEVDILPIADDNDEPARLADLIEGVAGEWSPFTHLLESASIDRHVVAASTRLPQTTPSALGCSSVVTGRRLDHKQQRAGLHRQGPNEAAPPSTRSNLDGPPGADRGGVQYRKTHERA